VGTTPATAAPKAAAAPPPAPAKPTAAAAPSAPAPAPAPASVPAAAPPPPARKPVDLKRAVAAAPSTRQFAREIGLDVREVEGTGPGGRVSVDDVKIHARSLLSGAPRGAGRPVAPPLPDFTRWGPVERVPLNAVKAATAQHMAVCWSVIPHVTLHDKADVTDLERLRLEVRPKADATGAKLTLTAFLVKIAASALKTHPNLNASFDAERNELVRKGYCHIGLAVDTDRGLLVPVLRDADRKNIFEIAVEMGELAARARARKLAPDDLQGACFSITNLGSIGGGFFTPIVNYPEVAILGLGRAATEPVLVQGMFQPRLMMPLSLSFDHRVIDGADGARFLRWIVDAVQQPVMLSLEG
jgi:pyruvate dehydrogenase E2 component (dihydrolipoamide acetyltransferase)